MRDDLTIGEAAKAAGTKPETVRYYERLGLLPPARRTEGNYRLYGPRDVERLRFLRRGRDLGFGLDDLRALLALADDPERDCAEVDRIARAHREAVERKIADLESLAGELRRLEVQCRGGRVAECRIIEALSPTAG
ncbi:MAG: helix-turn-helix domain-containing protein [Azospirillaceae bacterium]